MVDDRGVIYEGARGPVSAFGKEAALTPGPSPGGRGEAHATWMDGPGRIFVSGGRIVIASAA